MWADAHLALVAAGQEEDRHAQDVIWRQSEGVWGISLRMHGSLLSVLTCGGTSQHKDLQNLLSQPYCLSCSSRMVSDVPCLHASSSPRVGSLGGKASKEAGWRQCKGGKDLSGSRQVLRASRRSNFRPLIALHWANMPLRLQQSAGIVV